MTMSFAQAQSVLGKSEQICTPDQVQTALDQMAEQITEVLGELNPVILVVMNGALIPAGHLLTRLGFPFQIGYLHATRYLGTTSGKELHWIAKPSVPVENRVILVIDDIFDEGTTLQGILQDLSLQKAEKVYCATLVNKIHNRKASGLAVDFVGLDVPDRYVFGCGMDYNEYWRNLPGIWALKEEEV